ncbi:MAG TPA: hypothetical protein VE010_08525 [Thermoanaerobaculia bacterium]|nr:hypothetical protein [Thermoanaerobaculia bacterium]
MKSWVSVLLLLCGCVSAPAIDMNEPRRIVGTENSVRVDAQVAAEEARPGAQIPITYEVTNLRSTPIAIAEMVPETSYDREANIITVSIGSEVPGNQLLPRLIEIAPGAKKSFSTAARMQYVLATTGSPRPRPAAAFRLKVNFLGDTEPFRQLIGMKENAISDPQLADALFPLWLERNEVVYTNSIPMALFGKQRGGPDASTGRRGGF